MTPYAKAHLRLLIIQRRWVALITSRVRRPVLSKAQIRQASVIGDIALQMVEVDQDIFDMEVHSIDADAPTEEINTAALLVHAYARGEARGGSTDWDDINQAWEKACQELGPERVAAIQKLYVEDEDDDKDEDPTQLPIVPSTMDEHVSVNPSEYVEPDLDDPNYRGPRPPYL